MRILSLMAHDPRASRPQGVHEQSATGRRPLIDCVAEEVPVALEYNGISHVVMMASPGDLEDFALGFSLSEGLLASADELYDCEIERVDDHGVVIRLEIASQRFAALRARRRTLAGRSGCGLCGIESLQALPELPPSLPEHVGHAVTAAAVQRALRALSAQQPLFRQTGSVHAAAWAARDGELALVREDIGRHNALDKLLGAICRAGIDPANGFVVCTSRASYEMAQKAARLGVPLLFALSGPTVRAIDVAEHSGMTLAGFVRNERMVIYTHPWRIAGAATDKEVVNG